jgi:gliding motility-associated-like protein
MYSINGGPSQSSNVFPNLSPGTYFFSVVDAVGCTINNVAANVLPGPPLTASYTKRDITCFGANDGMITMDPPVGGTAPFEYSIDGINYQASNIFNGLAPRDYLVRFRDARGCTGDVFTFILEPPRLTATANSQPVRCNSESNGTISIQAQGGSQPFEYSLDGINFQASNTFNVPAGNYTVHVRDRNGCSFTTTVNVTEPVLLSATAATSNSSCAGNDGTITVTANGGNPSYQYSLDGTVFQSSNNFTVAPGSYAIVIRDNAGCITTINAIVGLTNNLTLVPPSPATICEGNSVQLQAVSNADQFQWSPSTGLDDAFVSAPIASPSITTQYQVTASLGICTTQASVMVTINPAPIPDAGPDGEICVGQSIQLRGAGGVSYEWSPADFLSNGTIAEPVASPGATIQYNLHVVGTNGCRSLQADQVVINVIPVFAVATSPADTVVSTGDRVQLSANSVGINYTWSPATGLDNPNIPNPLATVQSAITYKVVATTEAGCRGEGSVTIKTYKGPDIYVPTAFSPNNDGLNDIFKPFPVGITRLNYFRIYNRWGELVYSTTELNKGWDGNSGPHKQAAGVYVWMAQAVTRDDKLITKKGTVMLVR